MEVCVSLVLTASQELKRSGKVKLLAEFGIAQKELMGHQAAMGILVEVEEVVVVDFLQALVGHTIVSEAQVVEVAQVDMGVKVD